MQTANKAAMSADPAATAPIAHTPGFGHVLTTFNRWWHRDVSGTVDQAAVIEKRREECSLSARYLLMISMSAGIAILGLLLSSPAVVIGAMLLSPLMDPIMGVGFALAVGDFKWLKQSLRSLLIGSLFAIGCCALIVLFSPLQTVTTEIAARTRPNLFDLLVALFSAVAGAYAMIRGREGTIVGVAIATALMPPLAVVGFGLATANWTVFSGSLLLFVTNLTTIALVATAMARVYGFSSSLTSRQTRVQTVAIAGVLVALAVPLGLSLLQIGWETNASRQINSTMLDVFDGEARISQIDPDYNTSPIAVTATVLTPKIVPDGEARAARAMTRVLGRPVQVSLTQVRVGTGAQAAEEAQLSQARAQEAAAAAQAENVAENMALLAGVAPKDVTVDRQNRRAMVTALPIDGTTLAGYAELERRMKAAAPAWDIRLVPPLRALPGIAFEGETMATGSADQIALIVWAHQRNGIPVRLAGRADASKQCAPPWPERGALAETAPNGRAMAR